MFHGNRRIAFLAGLLLSGVLIRSAAAQERKAPAKPAPDPHAGHNKDKPQAGHEQHGKEGMGAHHHAMPSMSGMDHSQMDHASLNSAGMFLMGQSSGTAYQPAAWPMPMLMSRSAGWNLMWMGQTYVGGTQQTGPRGGDKFFSTNWGMLGGVRRLGRGSLMLRTMLSLDPLTVTDRRYPLLFQTGEAAFGRPIVDGQHPHDFVMELSAQYAHPIGEKSIWNVYYAPVGDVALGPVAYPHRASAIEIPQASLAHHWADSTHIANNVLTTGISYRGLRLEGSGFRGKEPGENRWNIDWGAMDSWAGRLAAFPNRNWMAQVSMGRLKRPEEFHNDDIVRATASVHHVLPRPGGTYLATSVIWARNYKTIEKHASHALIAETVVPLARKNFITGRFEWSQRDELFENDHHLGERLERETGQHAFNVAGFTAGYTRDVDVFRNVQTGIGANVTVFKIDKALKPSYGDVPVGVQFFIRVRLRGGE
jgi:hypothetical protein